MGSKRGSGFRVQGSGRRWAVGGRRLRKPQPPLTAHDPQPTTHSPLPTAYRVPPTAYCFALLFVLIPLSYASADDSPAVRRERIESMTAAEKEQLLEREAEFESLAPSKQERIKKLHEELQHAADAAQLRQVMHRYHEWLNSLPSYQRAQLLEMAPAGTDQAHQGVAAQSSRWPTPGGRGRRTSRRSPAGRTTSRRSTRRSSSAG